MTNPYSDVYKEKKGFPFGALAAIFAVLAVGLIGLSIWLYPQKETVKTEVEAEATAAAEQARIEQIAIDQKAFDAEVARTTKTFVSSADFGSISFEYPETWSSYVDLDGTGKDTTSYSVYFNSGMVLPVDDKGIYSNALVLFIQKTDLAAIDKGFESNMKKGTVQKDSYALSNGQMNLTGVRYSGNISSKNKDKTGSVIYFRIRDKVLGLYSYVPAEQAAIYNIVLGTIRWVE
ncbi:MAG: hypothetical protein LBK50_01065 [Candidatus Nomurabacteria bacterium]|jgi:hypothetical protein|nr:hypothetical protein [Candidatus Nomurabacteria bacterium]